MEGDLSCLGVAASFLEEDPCPLVLLCQEDPFPLEDPLGVACLGAGPSYLAREVLLCLEDTDLEGGHHGPWGVDLPCREGTVWGHHQQWLLLLLLQWFPCPGESSPVVRGLQLL